MSTAQNPFRDLRAIRVLIWIYFFLLIFEGALRKWILPGLSDPLLLVRDPFVLAIYLLALGRGAFPINGVTGTLAVVGSIGLVTGMTVGSQNLLVTGYGFDALFFHLPLIFIIPKALNRDHVIHIGRWVLILAVPMAVLMALQFRSSPDALINCGVSGSIGHQIRGALGKIRPPGFFAFITGAAQFLACATAFLIFGFWTKKTYHRLLLFAAGLSIVIGAAVSTSRLTLGAIGTVFVMIGVIIFYDRRGFNNALGILIPIGLILVIATNLDVFHEGREVFDVRFEEAGDKGAGVIGTATNWTARAFGDIHGGFLAMEKAPIFGAGIGVGTNVGARVLSGQYGFLLAEGEWARVILELGPLFGIIYLGVRLVICVILFRAAVAAARAGNSLPMLLFGSCAMLLMTGQFSQSTTLGFAVLGSGLCLAAGNVEPGTTSSPDETDSLVKKPRGRSRYAEMLHDTTPRPLEA